MNCDIILEAGDGTLITIDRDSSQKELESLQDIVMYLLQERKNDLSKFIESLGNSKTKINLSEEMFQKKRIINNCTFDELITMYPEQMDKIKDLKKDYYITLITGAYSAGTKLHGRVEVNGIITYVLTNEYDVQNFANTEYKKHLLEKALDENGILIDDNYLNPKYQKLLELIAKQYNFKSIKDLIIDYLDNKSKYNDKVFQDEQGKLIYTRSKLNDFCRELENEEVYNEDTESAMSNQLRYINYKREQFTRRELFDVLSVYNSELDEQTFLTMDEESIKQTLIELFKNDLVMSQYEIVKVQSPEKVIKTLNKTQEKELFKRVNNQKSEQNKKTSYDELTGKDKLEFYSGNMYITLDNQTYQLSLNEDDKFTYVKYNWEDSKIFFEKIKPTIKNIYNLSDSFGYDTLKAFQPVDKEGVVNGYYEGYYIYEHTPVGEKTQYIVSKSIINPDVYGVSVKGSISDAKLEIKSRNRSANVLKATKLNLKQKTDEISIPLDIKTNKGEILESINYKINPVFELPSQEFSLLETKKMDEIKKFYLENYNIDFSKLNTPESVGTAVVALASKGFNIKNLDQNIDREQMQNIVNEVSDKQYDIKQYYVAASILKNGKYITYLRAITDENKVATSEGFIINNAGDKNPKLPQLSLTEQLNNLKSSINNLFFKNSNMTIELTNDAFLKQMKDSNGNSLFESTNDIKAFIHNNTIYINQNKANVSDLIHETLHIMLGVLKVRNFEMYEKLLKWYDEKRIKENKDLREQVNTTYKGLAYIDRLEELVVIHWARQISRNKKFYYSKTDVMNEIMQGLENDFQGIYKSIQTNIKVKNRSDFEFGSFTEKDLLTEMQKRRLVTNAIEKGKNNGDIIEDCK